MSSTISKITLQKLLEEMKGSVAVYLTKDGIAEFRNSLYLRQNGIIVCSRIFNGSDSNFLTAEVRYYIPGSQVPKHSFIAIPHRYIKYLESDSQLVFKNFGQKN